MLGIKIWIYWRRRFRNIDTFKRCRVSNKSILSKQEVEFIGLGAVTVFGWKQDYAFMAMI